MKKLLILMLFGVLFVPMVGSAKADEVLYCQSELATGLYPDNGTWRTGTFTKYRYTIKVSGDFEKALVFWRTTSLSAQYQMPSNRIRSFVRHSKGRHSFMISPQKDFYIRL